MRRALWSLAVALCWLIAAPVAVQAGEAQTKALRLPFPKDDGTLTPYTFELGYPLVTLIYDTITWRDEGGVPRPWLARSLARSPDGTRVTIMLRPGLRWHDGVPLTAADVAFTFDYMRERPHPRFKPQLRDVARVEARGRLKAVVTLRRPSLGFADQPLADVPILPRHLWRGLAPQRRAPAGLPVGSGPYRLVERSRKGYRFRASRRYFKGRGRVRRIEVPFIRDAAKSLQALQRGRVDMLPVTLPAGAAQQLDPLSVRLRRGPFYLGTVLALNVRRPPFADAAVRRAVSSALNLERIARVTGDAVPADRGYLHPESAWASRAAPHRFDPRSSRQGLAGVADRSVRLLVPENDPRRIEAGRQVVGALGAVGLKARLAPLSPPALSRALGEDGSTPSFEAAISSSPPLASYDPDFLRAIFGPGSGRTRLNASGYRSAEFDRLAERVASAPDRRSRQSAVDVELRLLTRDAPVVPLFFSEGAFAYRPATYDGWVFVKGAGILDKRSFLPASGERARSGQSRGSSAESPGLPDVGPLGIAALVLAGAALLTGAAAVLRRSP
ncbi:MAG: ABC transporter substrate-binding protein [Actinomycetota bacterium]|nr:ABC transporter substrate-binding protein [Actinomycetota bacterium]